MPIPIISDTVQLIDPHAGNANAGNGGDGYSFGDISYSPSATIAPTQTVFGATSTSRTATRDTTGRPGAPVQAATAAMPASMPSSAMPGTSAPAATEATPIPMAARPR